MQDGSKAPGASVVSGRVYAADAVVIGAGSAGAVITRRLVDAGMSVLLLEAGGRDTNPAIHDPTRQWELWDSPDDWGYRTVPQKGALGRELQQPRGKVLGGSSSLNGMIYVRGWRGDYDHWAYLGNYGWGYEDVLPLFKRSEDFDGGESEYHGVGGPYRVTTKYEHNPIHEALVAGTQAVGIPFNSDHNGKDLDGVGFMQMGTRDGKRVSTATAFLGPVADHPNLTVLTSALARRLLFEGSRCTGVEFSHEGRIEQARAAHEVVVSAGTIESPKLLMLSGIGPAEELARHGIDLLVDLSGVGGNLHDHAISPMIFTTDAPAPPPAFGATQIQTQFFWKSRPGLVSPDLQPLMFSLPLYDAGLEGPPEGYTIGAAVIRPASRGSIRLRSSDPEEWPLIDPAYLQCEADVEALVTAVEICREIGNSAPLAEWGSRELYPGPATRTRDELREYVRRTVITYHHQVGTCKMGIDDGAVVDPELRVYGVTGLRVADASIMPAVTSGNTNAPAMMIGEKASDLILAAHALSGPDLIRPA